MKQIVLGTWIYLLGVIIFMCSTQNTMAQEPQLAEERQIPADAEEVVFDDRPRGNDVARIAFYNVENLFDTKDDPEKMDEAFTPTGMYGWSFKKYNKKLHQIYKVLVSVGGWEPAAVIGLCELENRFVLEQLLSRTPLERFDYQIVHQESPDKRGIDVGLIYRKEKFKLLDYKAIQIRFPFDTASRTRDILYVKGQLMKRDTVHIFVNHWPSRFGGHLETDPKRAFVAQTVRQHADSIYKHNPWANIIIMGDLNDAPSDKSLIEVLNAKGDADNLELTDLYNLMHRMEKNWWEGSHKHEEHWGILDQIIISPALVKRQEGLHLRNERAYIFKADWMLMDEEVRLGKKPFRTFLGARYLGGYSDHLPIYIDLEYR